MPRRRRNPEQHHFIQGECIVLAAGSKQGVVEGQEFALENWARKPGF